MSTDSSSQFILALQEELKKWFDLEIQSINNKKIRLTLKDLSPNLSFYIDYYPLSGNCKSYLNHHFFKGVVGLKKLDQLIKTKIDKMIHISKGLFSLSAEGLARLIFLWVKVIQLKDYRDAIVAALTTKDHILIKEENIRHIIAIAEIELLMLPISVRT